MSWVALEKASSQKKASDHLKKPGAGSVSASPPRAAPMMSYIAMIHVRFVAKASTMGLQKGLMTHGR